MKAIERDFPTAVKCKPGCDCGDGSEDIKPTGKTWECWTCHYKDNIVGEKNCIECGRHINYRG